MSAPEHTGIDRRLTVDRHMLEDAVATLRAEREAQWGRTEDRLARLESSDWTVETLKAHIESIFASREEATSIAMNAAEKAVEKAERLADIRAEGQTVALAQLRDQLGVTMSRNEYETAHAVLIDRLDLQAKDIDRAAGGSGKVAQMVPWVISIVVGLIAFAALLINLLGHVKF